MAFTGHGHQIIGSLATGIPPKQRARCGGPMVCNDCFIDVQRYHKRKENQMADNIAGIPFNSKAEGIDFPRMAKEIVLEHGVRPLYPRLEADQITIDMLYVVWFAFTLGNWKALISTSLTDGRYYEVTYSSMKSEAYVDTYVKTHNHLVHIL